MRRVAWNEFDAVLDWWGQTTLAGRVNKGVRLALIAAVTLAALAAWPLSAARAQDGKHAEALTWSAAPLAPRATEPANWLAKMVSGDAAGVAAAREYQVGDLAAFIPLGSRGRQPRAFALAYRSQHAYFWFERGLAPDEAELEHVAQLFDERIWPLNSRIYGGAETLSLTKRRASTSSASAASGRASWARSTPTTCARAQPAPPATSARSSTSARTRPRSAQPSS